MTRADKSCVRITLADHEIFIDGSREASPARAERVLATPNVTRHPLDPLEPLDKVWPLVREEGRYSTAQDLSPALRSAVQVQADDGRWQTPPSKRAAAALLVTDCCGSVCAQRKTPGLA